MKKIIASVVLIIALCVCLFSGYKIFIINNEYSKSEKLYSQQAEKYIKKDKKNNGNTVDFTNIQVENKDICGWIEIPAIKVSYPVLQGENNNSYLRYLPDGTYSIGGSIFVDERCKSDFSSPVTVIYGHYMYNGSMFGRLKSFLDINFLKNNDEFKIYTPNKTITAQIIACFEISKNSEIYNLPENEITEDYINTFLKETSVDLSSVDKENEKIILLSTCSHSFDSARTVVVAKFK